ncbi:hypothetical protein K470DRAFT_75378 [Piedraia hortae CBS 480.64]|uniref:GAT domain-containing protein n=1 Tax=Piedraia hortae CBS 480.64 TaxID=1314780 RepID=A0A6A7BYN2_9PEZI|nr:hypothetical protein K470DRAFT_75378 [Piedraia hortae CBS 480.64]
MIRMWQQEKRKLLIPVWAAKASILEPWMAELPSSHLPSSHVLKDKTEYAKREAEILMQLIATVPVARMAVKRSAARCREYLNNLHNYIHCDNPPPDNHTMSNLIMAFGMLDEALKKYQDAMLRDRTAELDASVRYSAELAANFPQELPGDETPMSYPRSRHLSPLSIPLRSRQPEPGAISNLVSELGPSSSRAPSPTPPPAYTRQSPIFDMPQKPYLQRGEKPKHDTMQDPADGIVKAIKTFCEVSSDADEFVHLPSIVEAAESSPLAAQKAAMLIREYLTDHQEEPQVQYYAVILIHILSDNPGPPFTRHFDENFVMAVKKLWRYTSDESTRRQLRDTLDHVECTRVDDSGARVLIKMWRREKANSKEKVERARTLAKVERADDASKHEKENQIARRVSEDKHDIQSVTVVAQPVDSKVSRTDDTQEVDETTQSQNNDGMASSDVQNGSSCFPRDTLESVDPQSHVPPPPQSPQAPQEALRPQLPSREVLVARIQNVKAQEFCMRSMLHHASAQEMMATPKFKALVGDCQAARSELQIYIDCDNLDMDIDTLDALVNVTNDLSLSVSMYHQAILKARSAEEPITPTTPDTSPNSGPSSDRSSPTNTTRGAYLSAPLRWFYGG